MSQEQMKNLTEAELKYIISDCQATIAAWPNNPEYTKYIDEMLNAAQELKNRKGK